MLIAKENHNSTIIWREINKKKKNKIKPGGMAKSTS